MTTGKPVALTIQTFVGKVTSVLFNMLSRFGITFLPRSKRLWISWLQSLSTVLFGDHENEGCHCFHFFLFYLPWSYGAGCHDRFFECWILNQPFHSHKKTLVPPYFSAIRVVSCAIREMWVWSLSWEDSLEESMATRSSILVQKIPLTEEPSGLQSMGS